VSPASLAEKGTESGEQKAVFAWAAMAAYKGFHWANDERAYTTAGQSAAPMVPRPVPELRWLHAIPNGGKRDPVTAARMKAEGARTGVADICLPVPRHGFHGLYIEMKKSGGRLSKEQVEFGAFVTEQGFSWQECVGWQEAVALLQKYLT
jgi:hypothetical protein